MDKQKSVNVDAVRERFKAALQSELSVYTIQSELNGYAIQSELRSGYASMHSTTSVGRVVVRSTRTAQKLAGMPFYSAQAFVQFWYSDMVDGIAKGYGYRIENDAVADAFSKLAFIDRLPEHAKILTERFKLYNNFKTWTAFLREAGYDVIQVI